MRAVELHGEKFEVAVWHPGKGRVSGVISYDTETTLAQGRGDGATVSVALPRYTPTQDQSAWRFQPPVR